MVPRGLPGRWQWILCLGMLQSSQWQQNASLSMQNTENRTNRLYTEIHTRGRLYTNTTANQQLKHHLMASVQAPGQTVSHTNPAASCISMLSFCFYWVDWSMLGHKIHCHLPGKARGITRNSIRCDPRLRIFFYH